jgi:hypothetical protein
MYQFDYLRGHAMIVYGSMDRQTLDAAYNNSAAVQPTAHCAKFLVV